MRRAGESQEAASQALPIHSLHTPDLAALQGSQGIATSLSALHNDIQNNAWQHLDGASQQNGARVHAAAQEAGHSQEATQQDGASNGGPAQQGAHVLRPFDQRFGSSQQSSQQGSQAWDTGSLHIESNSNSQQQARLPKRKLPFSVGMQPQTKRQSSGPEPRSASQQCSQSGAAEIERPKHGASAFVSPQKSPAGHSKPRLTSPSLLLIAQQESPGSVALFEQEIACAKSPSTMSAGLHTHGSNSHWTPGVSAMLH